MVSRIAMFADQLCFVECFGVYRFYQTMVWYTAWLTLPVPYGVGATGQGSLNTQEDCLNKLVTSNFAVLLLTPNPGINPGIPGSETLQLTQHQRLKKVSD